MRKSHLKDDIVCLVVEAMSNGGCCVSCTVPFGFVAGFFGFFPLPPSMSSWPRSRESHGWEMSVKIPEAMNKAHWQYIYPTSKKGGNATVLILLVVVVAISTGRGGIPKRFLGFNLVVRLLLLFDAESGIRREPSNFWGTCSPSCVFACCLFYISCTTTTTTRRSDRIEIEKEKRPFGACASRMSKRRRRVGKAIGCCFS